MTASPEPRLAVFDCDGTLVDSQHSIIAAMAVDQGPVTMENPAAGEAAKPRHEVSVQE